MEHFKRPEVEKHGEGMPKPFPNALVGSWSWRCPPMGSATPSHFPEFLLPRHFIRAGEEKHRADGEDGLLWQDREQGARSSAKTSSVEGACLEIQTPNP